MVDVIEATDFAEISASCRSRSDRVTERSPGRTGPRADLVFYDPYHKRCIEEATACDCSGVEGEI